ncbi:MAG: hypothetical protein J6W25_05305 [Bacilli bacterium]|nr:hypothetical protein [Bacilli bacterium]
MFYFSTGSGFSILPTFTSDFGSKKLKPKATKQLIATIKVNNPAPPPPTSSIRPVSAFNFSTGAKKKLLGLAAIFLMLIHTRPVEIAVTPAPNKP